MSRAPRKVAITSPKRHATETILVSLKIMTGYASKQVFARVSFTTLITSSTVKGV